ncbi:MAG TPA: histidine phosphatase family protein [Mycobacteriales bacterium]|nr:histidine phosphatase family protein [Mycobacteriales bacterium]
MTISRTAAQVEYRQARFQAPPGSTELFLVRHGESVPARPGEPFPLVDGHGDPELGSPGRHQAECVARRLGTERLDAIYVTPLRRTAQTAEPLARLLGLSPRLAPDLREVHLGEWEGGLFRQRVAQGHPVARRMLAEERWDVIPGAEPVEEFAARVRRGVDQLAAGHPDGRLAVFTHGGVIGQVLALASGSRRFAFVGADNGSVSRLVVTGQGWIVRGFNDVTHLTDQPDSDPARAADGVGEVGDAAAGVRYGHGHD